MVWRRVLRHARGDMPVRDLPLPLPLPGRQALPPTFVLLPAVACRAVDGPGGVQPRVMMRRGAALCMSIHVSVSRVRRSSVADAHRAASCAAAVALSVQVGRGGTAGTGVLKWQYGFESRVGRLPNLRRLGMRQRVMGNAIHIRWYVVLHSDCVAWRCVCGGEGGAGSSGSVAGSVCAAGVGRALWRVGFTGAQRRYCCASVTGVHSR